MPCSGPCRLTFSLEKPILSLTFDLDAQRADLAAHGHVCQRVEPAGDTTPLQLWLDLPLSTETRADVRYWYVTRPVELPAVLAWVLKHRVVALDLETSGLNALDAKIATLQLGVERPAEGDPHAVVLDVRCFTADDLAAIFAVIESRAVTKLGQNIRFEYRFLRAQYGVRARQLADTQVAEMVIRAGLLSPKGSAPGKGEERSAYKLCSMWSLMDRYTGLDIDKDKDLRVSFYATPPGEHTLRQIAYAATDVVYPFVIAAAQRKLIEERGLRGVIKVEMDLIPVLGELEHQGIGIDRAAWRALYQEAISELAKTEQALDEFVRPLTHQVDLFDTDEHKARPLYPRLAKPVNYSSSEQIRWAIKGHCGQIGWEHQIVADTDELLRLKQGHGSEWVEAQASRGRKVSPEQIPDWVLPEDRFCILTDADKKSLQLRKARGQLPVDLVDLLIRYSKFDQRVSSFGIEWLRKNVRSDTGRVHTEVHQATTNTGRLSMSPNLQQIPGDPRYRACFRPAPGRSYVIADYSQQEPRLLAQLSKDPTYLRTYLDNDDLYLAVAEAMLGHRPDLSTPEGKLERQYFKAIVLSMAYRSGVPKLRDQLTLGMVDAIVAGHVPAPTMEDARKMHKRFFEVHERILEFQNACSDAADPKGKGPKIWDQVAGGSVSWVRAPCGRLRFFPEDAKGTYTEGANAPIQGGSATMTKAAACLIQREIDDRGWQDQAFIVNMVHDEIVAEVDDAIAEEMAGVMRHCMEEAGKFYCPDVPVVAEFPKGSNGVVPYWMKEVA
jgi:DNA polymerase I-like protein with 3'-5' exonuclease and polymerase domains